MWLDGCMKAIEEAVKAAGHQAELARRINRHAQEVNRWVKRGWAPAKYAPAIEKATGVSTFALIADVSTKKKH